MHPALPLPEDMAFLWVYQWFESASLNRVSNAIFIDEDYEAQRRTVTCPGSHSIHPPVGS